MEAFGTKNTGNFLLLPVKERPEHATARLGVASSSNFALFREGIGTQITRKNSDIRVSAIRRCKDRSSWDSISIVAFSLRQRLLQETN